MNPLIQLTKAAAVFLIALACFGLAPSAHALLPPPPPDGGYPANNTAEGTNALFNLTTGANNTAVGFDALFGNTAGSNNTATGLGTLASNTSGSDNTAMVFPLCFLILPATATRLLALEPFWQTPLGSITRPMVFWRC